MTDTKKTNQKSIAFIKKIGDLINKYAWIFFILILAAGLYLRFYLINESMTFGWDQARDSWVVKDILNGKLTLAGPRTGIGNIHLGPLYFYLLAPFYYISGLDPIGSHYLNFLLNIVNFLILFIVTKKLFNNYAALFATLIYATNSYMIEINKVPWNVTLMPGVALLMFYAIIQIYDKKYKWFPILAALCGFYFHLHFTAIFLVPIVLLSFIFINEWKKLIKYGLFSLPLFLIWFVPTVVYELQNKNTNYFRMREFLGHYYIGFHLRFMLHRLTDSLIQFGKILNHPNISYLRFVIPVVFIFVIGFFDKNNKSRLFGYLVMLWFFVPLVGFTLYGGPLSEYYFLYNAFMVIYILIYLQERLLGIKLLPVLAVLIIFWSFYIHQNTHNLWIKPTGGGLNKQKEEVREIIKKGGSIEYNEGDIKAYLYEIWTKDKK